MGKGNPHRSGAKGAQSDRHYYGRKGNVTTGERPATRSRGSKLVDDPDVIEKQLNALLKSMKLYASQTSGDGNCLFRALSDQLYGSPDAHPQLRREICDYIEASPERFAGFVDVEKPFAEYVRNMRQSGVYGGHLELSAFASLKHKEIKIVQPGLVYRVTGHDDSPEAVAERAAIESRREARQARQPSGSERPPATMTKGGLSAREMRRRKRGDGRQGSSSSSAMAVDDDDAEQAVAATSKLAGEEDDDDDDDGPVEAFGPLYIAYHNWEHYSSLRNVDGPHSGLPRIKENNVASAAQTSPPVAAKASKRGPGVKGADYEDEDDEDEYRPLRPTEHEDLILRSVPGHTLQEVRHLLKQHGNLWETVVEVLIAQDAQGGRESPKSSSTTQAYMTRSRGVSHSYLSNSSNNANGAASSRYDQRSPLLPVPEHLRTESDAASSTWRQASPASSSGGDANSASTHATTTTASSSGDAATSVATTVDPRGSASPTQQGGSKLGSKRAASVDPLDLGDESSAAPSPKRRSSSREREREERSVDGALASEFDAAAKTVDGGASDESGNPSSAQSPATTLALSPQETTSQGDSTRPTTPARASAQEYSSTSFTYPLQSSRGLLSPPLSPSSINREEVRGMSKAEKREIELKRKRDRQRERRAKDRQLKESKAARAKDKEKPVAKGKKGAAGAAAATATVAAPTSKAAAAANRRRLNRLAEEEEEREREQGRKGRGSGGSGGGSDVPKGFVELKI